MASLEFVASRLLAAPGEMDVAPIGEVPARVKRCDLTQYRNCCRCQAIGQLCCPCRIGVDDETRVNSPSVDIARAQEAVEWISALRHLGKSFSSEGDNEVLRLANDFMAATPAERATLSASVSRQGKIIFLNFGSRLALLADRTKDRRYLVASLVAQLIAGADLDPERTSCGCHWLVMWRTAGIPIMSFSKRSLCSLSPLSPTCFGNSSGARRWELWNSRIWKNLRRPKA